VNVEDMTEKELDTLHRFYAKLAALAEKETDIHASHSVEEAQLIHKRKSQAHARGKG
jgi:hypothetical protein